MRPKLVLIIAIVFAFCPLPAQAQFVAYDNVGLTSVNRDGIEYWTPTDGPFAASFTSGGTASTLDSLQLRLGSNGGTDSVTVKLYANQNLSTHTGAELATLGSFSSGVIPNTETIYTVSLQSHPALTANTRYWIGITTSGGNLGWYVASGFGSTTGVINEFQQTANDYGQAANIHANSGVGNGYQMKITTAAVPEPAGCAVVAGLAALGFAGWRRRARSGR